MSVQKVPIARLAKPPKAQFTHVNEYFGGKRNAASGTLWTDTNYVGRDCFTCTEVVTTYSNDYTFYQNNYSSPFDGPLVAGGSGGGYIEQDLKPMTVLTNKISRHNILDEEQRLLLENALSELIVRCSETLS